MDTLFEGAHWVFFVFLHVYFKLNLIFKKCEEITKLDYLKQQTVISEINYSPPASEAIFHSF